jgi:hypothetical protein
MDSNVESEDSLGDPEASQDSDPDSDFDAEDAALVHELRLRKASQPAQIPAAKYSLPLQSHVTLAQPALQSHMEVTGSLAVIQPALNVSKTTLVDGVPKLKVSLVARMLSLHEKQSTDCGRRVQGQTQHVNCEKQLLAAADESTADENELCLWKWDYIACLARCHDGICLLALQAKRLEQSSGPKSGSWPSIPWDELEKSDSNVMVHAQILDLYHVVNALSPNRRWQLNCRKLSRITIRLDHE